jgi:hypothetical protein
MNIETETMKQWAESVSKAHDLLVWGHHLRVKEILQEVRDNIRIAVEEAPDEDELSNGLALALHDAVLAAAKGEA